MPKYQLKPGREMGKVLFYIFIIALFLVGIMFFFSRPKKIENDENKVLSEFAELENRSDLTQATIAGGCFWCMEGPFEEMEGVEEVISGFTGGTVEDPTYEEVVKGTTGHKEAVRIYYDPNKVTYAQLLEKFWWQIDPTDPGGQFADRGTQYQTAIFYGNENEKEIAEKSKKELEESGNYDAPIVTEILPVEKFYPADDYHQDFYKHSAERYQRYKKLSGREGYIEEIKKKLGIE